MEIIADLLKILGRIITILPLMLLVALFMGRRSIGELPVFDFLLVLTLGAVVGADIAEPEINHLYTAFAIVAIGILQKIFSELSIRNDKFKKLTTFAPVVVVKDGLFLVNNLKKINYSLENILEFLREDGIFNITEVGLALIEANGKLSVYRKPEKAPAVGIAKPSTGIAYPVILEGKVSHQTLSDLNLNEDWLHAQLKSQGFTNSKAVFFAAVDADRQVHISPYSDGRA
ncbi:DUF421 domain-containing protein [Sporomusa termitida]|uniref:YetF C-terminal domain-containing protein n=1 Tax=Sporomusa termitida TaxID=2377 RepID=A0A517DWY0_9FIRM|nr:DUF421 domain-containing protein [Sporomusa termitida]QDR81756.1 hypothetical protein SPTER_31680 [Sporomusa termitida]